MSAVVKFTPNGGAAFEVRNVLSVAWEADRHSAANGTLGQPNHNLANIVISRQKSMPDANGQVTNETETVHLAAALEAKAYFSGSITLSSPDDQAATIQTLRWDKGHVCDIKNTWTQHGMMETLSVAVTGLKVDNSEFKRN